MNKDEQFIQELKEKPVITLATALMGAIFEYKLAPDDIQRFFPGITKCASSLNESEALKHLDEMSSDEVEALKRLPFSLVQQQILGMFLMHRDERKIMSDCVEHCQQIQKSRLSDLWSRYFKEIDNGNPRTAVLESLVDLIKFFEEEEREDKRQKNIIGAIDSSLPKLFEFIEEMMTINDIATETLKPRKLRDTLRMKPV